MIRKPVLAILAALAVQACAAAAQRAEMLSLQDQGLQSERAFARTMANRDRQAFSPFLSDEAVFFSGDIPVRGRQAAAADWKRFFEGAVAPFSWEPDHVEVLESGSLALSTGPVYDPDGKVIGRFNSVWRREQSGEWRVVFDKGSPVCPPARPAAQ